MKKIILSAVAVLGIVAANNANAQHFTDTKIGIKGGFNLANITNRSEALDESKALPTFNAGFVAVVPMSHTFSLRTGLDVQSKGTRATEGNVSIKQNPIYLELPVNLAVMLPFNEKVKGYVGAGPYAAVGIAGKMNVGTTSTTKNISWGNDKPGSSGTPGSDFKRFDAGVNIIAGLDFGKVGVHAQYGFGMVNTQPGESAYWQQNKKHQHRVLGVSGVFYF